jgi:hypothetical protein
MDILTGTRTTAAHLSVKDIDLGVPKYRPGEIIEAIARSGAAHATPFRVAAWTGNLGLRATIVASGPATEESKLLEKVIKSLASSIAPAGKGAVKGYELGQSSLKLATTYSDPASSLLEKVAVTVDVGDDLVSFAKVAFPQIGGNPIVQAVGCSLKVGALVVDLVGSSKEERKLPF